VYLCTWLYCSHHHVPKSHKSKSYKFRSPDIGILQNVRFSVKFHSSRPHLRQAGKADSFGSPSQGQIRWEIRSVVCRSHPCRTWNPEMPEKKSGQFWVPAPSIRRPIKMRLSKLYVRSSEIRNQYRSSQDRN
jgi:hypothetical protein